jgi:hypothetical protein
MSANTPLNGTVYDVLNAMMERLVTTENRVLELMDKVEMLEKENTELKTQKEEYELRRGFRITVPNQFYPNLPTVEVCIQPHNRI